MAYASMTGTRLEYVVRALDGTVKREKIEFEEIPAGRHKDGTKRFTHQMKRVEKDVPAGFMVYFPRGHVLRLTAAQLKQHKLDKKPKIINLEGLNDPNSPLGQLIMQQDQESRDMAFQELEKQVIQMAVKMAGPIQLPEQLEQMKARVARGKKPATGAEA